MRGPDGNLVWMSCATLEQLEANAYTNGPAPWSQFAPDFGDIVVVKNRRGETVVCEDWEGNSILIPSSHSVPK